MVSGPHRRHGERDRAPVSLARDEGGAVYVEFLIAFIPLFIFFLGILQLSLVHVGNLVVHHAATTAARSAVVVLPDDPSRYDDEEVNEVAGGGGGAGGGFTDPLAMFLEWGGGFGTSGGSGSDATGGARWSSVRAAASLPLLSVSPSYAQLVGEPKVYHAVGGSAADRALTGAGMYNKFAVAVTFPTRPGADSFRTRFGPNDDVTVRVTYLFHCGVPMIAPILCNTYPELRSGEPLRAHRELIRMASSGHASRDELESLRRRIRHAQERLDHAQKGLDELEYAEEPSLGYLSLFTGARFKMLRAEATLRNHGASYEYSGGGPVAFGGTP